MVYTKMLFGEDKNGDINPNNWKDEIWKKFPRSRNNRQEYQVKEKKNKKWAVVSITYLNITKVFWV